MKKLVALVAMVSLLGANVTVLAAEEPQLYYDENGEECYTTVEITEEEEAEETEYEEDNDGFLYFKDCGCAVYEDEEVFCPECDPEYEEDVEESSDDFEEVEEHVEETAEDVEEDEVVEVAANTKGYENEQKLFENNFGKEN